MKQEEMKFAIPCGTLTEVQVVSVGCLLWLDSQCLGEFQNKSQHFDEAKESWKKDWDSLDSLAQARLSVLLSKIACTAADLESTGMAKASELVVATVIEMNAKQRKRVAAAKFN